LDEAIDNLRAFKKPFCFACHILLIHWPRSQINQLFDKQFIIERSGRGVVNHLPAPTRTAARSLVHSRCGDLGTPYPSPRLIRGLRPRLEFLLDGSQGLFQRRSGLIHRDFPHNSTLQTGQARLLRSLHDYQVVAEIEETPYYYAFPREHWRCLRTNNPLERLLREVRRRTRAVGAFPDGKSALMLAARLRHVAGTKWGTRRYLDMNRLSETSEAA